ncbi:MAG: alpha/beta fold hydrolase, partial [Actinomycetota bacterium]
MAVQAVVSADGTEIKYALTGSGRPVLLIHGFPDDHSLWVAQAEALAAAGMQAVSVDQRGFGKSGKPDDPMAYRVSRAMTDMVAVLDDLGHQTAAVVGHDWGAATASAVALFAPERVERLVLLSAGHPGVFHTLGLRQFELAWYMQFFQAPDVAEQWLRADDWANFTSWC